MGLLPVGHVWNTSLGRRPEAIFTRCPNHLSWVLLNVEEQQIYSELLPNRRASHSISKGESGDPAEKGHFGRLYPRSRSFGHYPELVTIGAGTKRPPCYWLKLLRSKTRRSADSLRHKETPESSSFARTRAPVGNEQEEGAKPSFPPTKSMANWDSRLQMAAPSKGFETVPVRRKGHNEGEEKEGEEEEERSSDEGFMGMTPLLQAHHAMEKMEEFVHKMWEGRWRVIPHDVLPDWLKDNDFLLHGHRPPMPSFRACFKSIFRIHTETGNIWTHLLGCLFFLCLGIVYMFRPNMSFVAPFQEKIVIGMFFLGAILCLSFSWLFHTVYCHSEGVSRVFSKLDYSGIAFLIMGSFVPWLYYSFYCSPQPCFIYLIVVCVLGLAAITVSQCDFFATPQYRGVRAGVFVGLGLSGVVPTLHFVITEGFLRATTMGQMGWLFLMAALYITGACLYAARIPERFFPGKCDIWFHSHQLFHILVVAGAFVHFHGVSNLQEFRYTAGAGCAEDGALLKERGPVFLTLLGVRLLSQDVFFTVRSKEEGTLINTPALRSFMNVGSGQIPVQSFISDQRNTLTPPPHQCSCSGPPMDPHRADHSQSSSGNWCWMWFLKNCRMEEEILASCLEMCWIQYLIPT
ncbi:hypothetical protein AOLI_G00313390 [Acnodon oligacanthus]